MAVYIAQSLARLVLPGRTSLLPILTSGVLNLALLSCATAAFVNSPTLIGTALLGWALGLRHGADPDHIIAIDNVVRHLLNDARYPALVGLYFSLGHSTVVLVVSTGVLLCADELQYWLGPAATTGNLVGAVFSSVFLIWFAGTNIVSAAHLWYARGRADEVRISCGRGGLAIRVFQPLFRGICRPWQMYPVGFLFGFGMDTSVKVCVLMLAARAASQGTLGWRVMIIPLLFTFAMVFVDTADSVVMTRVYAYACGDITRRLWYNLLVTVLSAFTGLALAGSELLGVLWWLAGVGAQ